MIEDIYHCSYLHCRSQVSEDAQFVKERTPEICPFKPPGLPILGMLVPQISETKDRGGAASVALFGSWVLLHWSMNYFFRCHLERKKGTYSAFILIIQVP